MMLNKKSSRMSAWKALYVIPLVGISLAATAETKVDYLYEGQQTETAADTPVGKDSKNSFKEKNLHEGRLITDEENGAVTMIYYGLDGKQYTAEWTGLNMDENVYMVNGAVVTDKALFDKEIKAENIVILNSYLKNGKKVMAAVTPDREFVEVKAHLEINVNPVTNNLVVVVNGERMPEGFDLNTIDPKTIASMEVLKTEKALQEYDTDKGVIVITTDPTKANEKKPAPDIYINGKKATSEEIAALPANPRGSIASDGTVWITTEDEPEEKPLNSAPSFNGGSGADFQKWVLANIRYPEGTSSEGRVAVSFTVSETGKVTDVKVLRGSDQKLNDEAVRVISSSPDWTPAIEDGKPVAVQMLIPVEFKK